MRRYAPVLQVLESLKRRDFRSKRLLPSIEKVRRKISAKYGSSMDTKKIEKIVWVAFVLVVLYFHLLVGTLLAIATAFYWLLERHLIGKSSTLVDNPPERLWCVMGKHWIGKEPYSFYPETEHQLSGRVEREWLPDEL